MGDGGRRMNRPAETPSTPPVDAFLDLSPEEAQAVGSGFSQILADVGVDGEKIFETLRDGGSFASALGVPRGGVELLYARAYRWTAIGRFEKALSLFRVLCLLESRAPDYWIGYGVCLKMTEQLDAAIRAFQTAQSLRPIWCIPHYHLLGAAIRQANWAVAEAELKEFDRTAASNTPKGVRDEVERYRSALALRRALARTRAAGGDETT
jgi:tetratricopeptide (TPR) repeat protein